MPMHPSADECALAEMRETNKQLGLLTQNLNKFTTNPLGTQPLGRGVTISKRPYYPDSTTFISRDNGGPVQIMFDPGVGNWAAIVWAIFGQNITGDVFLFHAPRFPSPAVLPAAAPTDGIITHPQMLFGHSIELDVPICCNFFPGAFIIPPNEVLWGDTEQGSGRVALTLGYTVGQLG